MEVLTREFRCPCGYSGTARADAEGFVRERMLADARCPKCGTRRPLAVQARVIARGVWGLAAGVGAGYAGMWLGFSFEKSAVAAAVLAIMAVGGLVFSDLKRGDRAVRFD